MPVFDLNFFFNLWLCPTSFQANVITCKTYPDFHVTETIISWGTTALTYFEREYTQKIITSVSSGHLRVAHDYQVCLRSRSTVLPPHLFSSKNIDCVCKACSAWDKDHIVAGFVIVVTLPQFLLLFPPFALMGAINLVLWFLNSHWCHLGLSASMP